MSKRNGKHSRAQEALKSRGAMQPRKAGALSATDLSHGFPGIPSWMNPVEAVQVYEAMYNEDEKATYGEEIGAVIANAPPATEQKLMSKL